MSNRWRSFHIGFLVLLFLLLSISYYHELLPGTTIVGKASLSSLLGSSEHRVENFVYILLVVYASWAIGTKVGIAVLLLSAAALLPKAMLFSANTKDASLQSISALVMGGLIVLFIEARRRSERQEGKFKEIAAVLKSSEEQYEDLFANASDAIWVHDLDGKIVIANKASAKLAGYPLHELIGENVSQFIPAVQLPLAREVKTKLLEGEVIEQRYEQRVVRKDGTERIIELSTRLIESDKKPAAFQNIARDITAERKLRNNLHIQVQKVFVAQEEERKRIARELHDDIAQSILVLTRRLDLIASEYRRKLPVAAVNELEDLRSIANSAYRDLQRYARDLRPVILDQLGLLAALRWLAGDLSNDTGIKVGVKTEILPTLPPETELAMFRIAQEALNNVRKHAGASEVSIQLELDTDKIKMSIIDNGKGIAASELTGELATEGKLGVLGMQERASLLGGNLEIKSEEGKGTSVILEAPFGQAASL